MLTPIKKSLPVLLFFLILIPKYSHSMGRFRQQFAKSTWKATAAGLFAGTLTAAHYGIFSTDLVAPFFGDKIGYDVSPETESFVKEVLSKRGYTNQERLHIKNVYSHMFHAMQTTSHDYIFLGGGVRPDTLVAKKNMWYGHDHAISENIKDPLKGQLLTGQPSHQYLTEVSGILEHEGGHLINNDGHRRIGAIALSSCCIELCSFFLRKYHGKFLTNYWIKNILKVPTGAFKASFAYFLTLPYLRHREQLADDGITNDKKTLKGQKRFFKRFQEVENKASFLSRLFDCHYPNHIRMRRFQERIQALK